MVQQFYKPKEEKIGPDIGYKDNGSDVKYYPENKIQKRIKIVCYILCGIVFLFLIYSILK